MRKLSQAMRDARKRAGLTQTDAEGISGMSRRTISALEKDRSFNPTLLSLRALAGAYGCTVSELIGEIQQTLSAREKRVTNAVIDAMRKSE